MEAGRGSLDGEEEMGKGGRRVEAGRGVDLTLLVHLDRRL